MYTHRVIVKEAKTGGDILDVIESDARTAYYFARSYMRRWRADGVKVVVEYGPLSVPYADTEIGPCFNTSKVTHLFFS